MKAFVAKKSKQLRWKSFYFSNYISGLKRGWFAMRQKAISKAFVPKKILTSLAKFIWSSIIEQVVCGYNFQRDYDCNDINRDS